MIPGVALTPEVAQELNTHAGHSVGLVAKIESLGNDPVKLSAVLGYVQSKLTALEETRLGIAKPMNEAKSNLDSHFRNLKAPYEEAKGLLKSRLEAIEIERRRLLAAAHAPKPLPSAGPAPTSAGLEPDRVYPADPVFALPTPGPAVGNFRDEWTWELEDISKVPLEFLAVNAATLKLYLSRYKNSNTVPPISGLKLTKVPKAVAR